MAVGGLIGQCEVKAMCCLLLDSLAVPGFLGRERFLEAEGGGARVMLGGTAFLQG